MLDTDRDERAKQASAWAGSPASLACRDAIPSLRSSSSRELGWSSLLVDVHHGVTWNQEYTAGTTLDPRIGVSLTGQYLSHYHASGRWRPDTYRPGTTTVLRSAETRRFRFAPLDDDECRFALLYFPQRLLDETAEHWRRPGQRAAALWFNQVVTEDGALSQVARSVIRAMRAGADSLYADTVSAWLAAHVLLPRAFGTSDDERCAGEISDKRLRRVVELIAARFAEPLTLSELAAEAGISKFHFTRLFRQKLGRTPYRFLTETRLTAARSLLIGTDLSIGEVASYSGFSSPSRFATAFASKFGASAQAVRAAHRRGSSNL